MDRKLKNSKTILFFTFIIMTIVFIKCKKDNITNTDNPGSEFKNELMLETNQTVLSGKFSNGAITNLHKVNGTINISNPFWVNLGVSVSVDDNSLWLSNIKFKEG